MKKSNAMPDLLPSIRLDRGIRPVLEEMAKNDDRKLSDFIRIQLTLIAMEYKNSKKKK